MNKKPSVVPGAVDAAQESSRRARGLLPWPGGKSWLVPRLLKMMPPHTCYCEVFGGSGALLLTKDRSPLEVYNDAKSELVNLFRVVRFHRDELLAELELVLNSREEFAAYCQQPGLTDIQRAARWFFRVQTCFGGTSITSFGVSKLTGGAAMSSRIGRLEKLAALSARLDRVCIENLDWRDCLERYDGPETFFFLDPPYTQGDAKLYGAWNDEQMQELAARIGSLKGHWLLTVDDSPNNRETFKAFRLIPVSRANGIENRPGRKLTPIYRELLIRRGETR